MRARMRARIGHDAVFPRVLLAEHLALDPQHMVLDPQQAKLQDQMLILARPGRPGRPGLVCFVLYFKAFFTGPSNAGMFSFCPEVKDEP
jgi:hypothetical protein